MYLWPIEYGLYSPVLQHWIQYLVGWLWVQPYFIFDACVDMCLGTGHSSVTIMCVGAPAGVCAGMFADMCMDMRGLRDCNVMMWVSLAADTSVWRMFTDTQTRIYVRTRL